MQTDAMYQAMETTDADLQAPVTKRDIKVLLAEFYKDVTARHQDINNTIKGLNHCIQQSESPLDHEQVRPESLTPLAEGISAEEIRDAICYLPDRKASGQVAFLLHSILAALFAVILNDIITQALPKK
ncbi:hypothetical protein NDU88_003355 [Pleurodeles waltl]|uniref:Uncharacterized protein n=1 Tax=Pleurodeles waltl TaxID=8319 RepID=A0AAV7W1W3_PLEWA|nr:hypothetical protein NDU88_003355 [Pleurodeles waltl]